MYQSCIYGENLRQSSYKPLFENIALFPLPLNCILLSLQLEVIILDLGPEKLPLTETLTLQSSRKKKTMAGNYFYQEDTE